MGAIIGGGFPAGPIFCGAAMDRDAPPPVTPRRLPRRRWLLPAAILGWIVPGLGQLWTGQPRKALLFALAILRHLRPGLVR